MTDASEVIGADQCPKRNNGWIKGALTRGFYSAVQAFHAANLSIIMLAPKTARIFGFEKLTGGTEKLKDKIAALETKIEDHDIEPVKPNYAKSGFSFLMFNLTYLAPIISIGLAAGLAGGPFAALITAGLINTHAQMGEAFVQTSRRRAKGFSDKEVLDKALEDKEFTKAAKTHVSIMGAVCLGITLAAGPLARLLGGFTSGALSSLSRTPIGGFLTEKFINAAHKNVVKSIRKPLGKFFSNIANNGPSYIAAKTAASVAFARAATNKLTSFMFKSETQDEKSKEADEPAQADIANDNIEPDIPEHKDVSAPAP